MIDTDKVYNEDCLEGMKRIPDKSIDMVLCDLPYGTTKCRWDTIIPFEPLWDRYKRIIKDHGAIVLFGSEPFSSYLRMSRKEYYRYDLYWDKVLGTGFASVKKQPMRTIETISIFYKNQPVYNPQMIKRKKELDTRNWKNDKRQS
jgi:site-specific DNA-methyltransferase (adenine-specific)